MLVMLIFVSVKLDYGKDKNELIDYRNIQYIRIGALINELRA